MKPFSPQDIFKERVNREADYEWAKTPQPEIPKFIPTEIEKNKPCWTNFFIDILFNFRP